MPINPIKTADHLLIPTFSERNIIEKIVTKIGPAKVKDITSAKGKFHKLGQHVLKDNNVLVLDFDKYGILRNKEFLTKNDIKKIKFIDKTTENDLSKKSFVRKS